MFISMLLVLLVPLYMYLKASSRSKNTSVLPTNWPILHMFPSFMVNVYNLHDYLTLVLAGLGHNFRAHGPPGTGMRFFVTCDPANVRHIFTTNYTNFPKSVLSNPRMIASTEACCRNKVENILLPLLAYMASTGTPFDVQELMSRFMFDLATMSLFGVDPGLLSLDKPPMDAVVALNAVMEVGFFQHTMPTSCWKLMRWLNIGRERKLCTAHKVLQRFLVEMMERRKMEMMERKINTCHVGSDDEQDGVDIMSSYPDYVHDDLSYAKNIGYMLPARDTIGTTLTWIFYNLAQNANIVSIIRSELSPIASCKGASGVDAMMIFEPNEIKSLVYLRAVLYETLRLYPPTPFERKTVSADDIMPSGHEVHTSDTILISLYSLGRMEGVWGNDCLEYNPDRWLLEDGNNLRYVPSHKFLAFNLGPRICLGKEIAVMHMKTIIASVLWNFDVEVMEGQSIQPKPSCILEMKNGLIVKLKKREM
ncbi:hypothetical protein CFC21_026975 [Triticum aestivum]|uniref:Cytochrome P450 n=3 Tax=Triticinae TaxID=1648030 RepID=A0A9R1EMN5_WHEAT|nr:hypothetical protein CFC21_026975 [Triticum aestivum]